MKVYDLPADLRQDLSTYIQANPSPNVPVGDALKIIMRLQNLSVREEIKGTPKLVEDESFVEPGDGKEDTEIDNG